MGKSNLNQISALLNRAFTLPKITGEFVITEKLKTFFLEKEGTFYGTIHQFSETELTARNMYFGKMIEHEIPLDQIQFK